MHEWLDHSVSDAHSVPTLVGMATVGQCIEVHLEVIPHIQNHLEVNSVAEREATTATDHLSF